MCTGNNCGIVYNDVLRSSPLPQHNIESSRNEDARDNGTHQMVFHAVRVINFLGQSEI